MKEIVIDLRDDDKHQLVHGLRSHFSGLAISTTWMGKVVIELSEHHSDMSRLDAFLRGYCLGAGAVMSSRLLPTPAKVW